MVSLTQQKSPISLHIFSSMNKSSTSSSSITTTMKLKTLIHNLIFSHICHVVRAFSKAKTIFLELFKENQLMCMKPPQRKDKYMKKILFGSFRLHYNWCSSSHVMPINSSSSSIFEGINDINSHIYYDSTWNSVFSTDLHHEPCNNSGIYSKEEEGELSSYLQWLEEKKSGKTENMKNDEGNIENEIDKLADMFIASCHEKFRLEKIESYRRYQEMLARSM